VCGRKNVGSVFLHYQGGRGSCCSSSVPHAGLEGPLVKLMGFWFFLEVNVHEILIER
jgi:hypothetical protein